MAQRGPDPPGTASAWSERGGFAVGNAAGEAHPILGEGISMAMQGAFLLCARLELERDALLEGAHQGGTGRLYGRDWRRAFGARIRWAALFARARDAPRRARAASGAEGVARAAHGGRDPRREGARRAGHIVARTRASERLERRSRAKVASAPAAHR